jgi:uncharacterized RDD family membrane protein YckC
VAAVAIDSYMALLPSVGVALVASPDLLSESEPSDEVFAAFFATFYVVFLLILLVQILWTAFDGLTVGKALMKIQVVRYGQPGRKIGFWRALGRYLAFSFATMLCYLPFWFALADKNNRSIHDHMFSTVVVSRGSARPVTS